MRETKFSSSRFSFVSLPLFSLCVSLQALYTNSSIDERGEPVEEEEEEDHTYELLLTAQTKVPPSSQEHHSHKGKLRGFRLN